MTFPLAILPHRRSSQSTNREAVVAPPSTGSRTEEVGGVKNSADTFPQSVEGIQSELICSEREKRTNSSVAFPLSDFVAD